MQSTDVLVIGAGHAGCEAALAAARRCARVVIVTLRADRVAQMSCNPAIGGVGKGHLVREIDALGGCMGRLADATGIQFRRLNSSRGPAVRSTRAQSDSHLYKAAMTKVLEEQPLISLVEDEVLDIIAQDGRVRGVVCRDRGQVAASSVIITTGTFLNGLCHVGETTFAGGRVGDEPATRLSGALQCLGIHLERFKTGTTPRLARDSIDFDQLEAQEGDDPPPRFSFDPVENHLKQVCCHITFTNERTHEVIRQGLDRSPLFQGVIEGLGPRYCPSIEDKVVKFPDKARHQIFLEPEGLATDWIYPNGLATSLPRDVQVAFLHSMPGLQRARVVQWGYAVEYDYAPPLQLLPTLMSKKVRGLFFAGQINGTSGYEEAAAQGLMAGLNACRFVEGLPGARLGREEAYIGVLVDDLVTKGVDEPYRMFTSRAEHRLTLREANAEERLWQKAVSWGLLSQGRADRARARTEERAQIRGLLDERVGNDIAAKLGLNIAGELKATILRRPEIGMDDLILDGYDPAAKTMVEEEIKYKGYIEREKREIRRLSELEGVRLPNLDFSSTPGLSREIREKLGAVRPATLGQASRIPGMTPAALAVLRIYARRAGA